MSRRTSLERANNAKLENFEEAGEINYDENNNDGKDDMDSYDYLYVDVDEQEELQQEEMSEAIKRGIKESEEIENYEDETLWKKDDLGKYTVKAPTTEKQQAAELKGMKPVDLDKFHEISGSMDKEDKHMQELFEKEIQELEGIF